MTIVECLKTRPYICTNGIYADECDYPYNPYISAGDYAYILQPSSTQSMALCAIR